MSEVMALSEAAMAPREAAVLVPMVEGTAEGRRNRPGPRPDLDHAAVSVVSHHHAAGVARQALRRFRGNAGAPLEEGLAGLVRICQDLGVDMYHHLVALSRSARIEAVMQGRLGEKGQAIGLLLGDRRRLRGNVPRPRIERRPLTVPLIQALAGRGEGLHEQRPHLGLESPFEDDHAVLCVIHV
jgi:hypothetical protein